jgi:fucose 4-O-acetylase-like acetyltransferase
MIKIRWCICGIFLVSLIVGLLPEFNGTFSFSKTVCFYGYFLLGYYSNKETLDKIRRNKNIIIILGIIIMIIIYAYCAIMGIDRTVLTAVLGVLSKSDSYKDAGMNIANGIIMRMASIPVSIILGMIVMIFTPVKKNIFTRIGRNSIIIFIFHEYFVVLSWGIMRLLNVNIAIEIVLSLIFSIGITLFLSIDAFQRLYEKIMRTIETIILKE